jgi:hypothetical protein
VQQRLPEGKPFTHERAVWAFSQFGQPNAQAFGADVARALRTLIDRGALVPCTEIPLVRTIADPLPLGRRPKRFHPWVDTYGEEQATLWYPRERRVRFVRRG